MLTYPSTQSVYDDARRRASRPPSSEPGRDDVTVLQGLQVMIVEDDPDSRDLLTLFLEDAGCTVLAVASAQEAFDAIPTFAPQVLISDIGMPDEDGYSLMLRVRAREAREGGRLPAMALTAFTSPADVDRAREVGFDAHTGKPISIGELLRMVASLARSVRRA